MHILFEIVYYIGLILVGLFGLIFSFALFMALCSGFNIWIECKHFAKKKTKPDFVKPANKKRPILFVIKDSATIVLWALIFAFIVTVSSFITLLTMVYEWILGLFGKKSGKLYFPD